ncbi:NAD(P)-binding protein [Bimuria novae-zelandiae CBS 107.79]|uniref:NAD(P)-binding protein n=1 Tax=Bimuria novae-zelandiae CBS 107.79 TaxID=1447943 RepID=A0A6A5VQ33_9PLEO|nr:NAD(P)-binding protein [Bimuria novae-zelandiae CBS 107.79]
MPLKNKAVVITSAASGMGLETARLFPAKGAKLSLADIQEKPLKDLEAELLQVNSDVMSQVVDVSNRKSVEDWGLMYCLHAQAPVMNEGGAIVNAASILGLIGAAKSMPYVASKHAVLGARNIRVNCFCPGPIDTPMFRKLEDLRGNKMDTEFLALKRKADQKEIPPLIEFLLSDSSSYITGVAMPVDGGWFC